MTFEPAPFPLQSHLGMTVTSPTPGREVAVVDLSPALHNPNGAVHGTVLFAMADTSMGAATMSILDDELACASIEVHVRFLRAATTGRLTAKTEVLKRGRRVVQLASRILDERDEVVARWEFIKDRAAYDTFWAP